MSSMKAASHCSLFWVLDDQPHGRYDSEEMAQSISLLSLYKRSGLELGCLRNSQGKELMDDLWRIFVDFLKRNMLDKIP